MDKIYQVFVSSTFHDLQDERKEVMQALLELDCMPAGMELFPASNDDQWTLIKRVIDACDYYLLIIGGRYGSINNDGKSYTQMEFEYAIETGKPIISFLPKYPDKIEVGKTDKDNDKKNKLDEFKKLAQKKLVKYWDTPENLGSIVSRSMVKLIKDFPAEGWIKAGRVIDEESIKEIAELQRENRELKDKIEKISTEAPEGTSELAQGEDLFTVDYTFTGISQRNYYEYRADEYDCEYSDSFTWNEIFSYVAPSMINECTDYLFRNLINTSIEQKSTWKSDKEFEDLIDAKCFQIKDVSFNQIKIQLRALGLIVLGDKKRPPSDNQTYWKLTSYGDTIMNRIMAIKR